MAGQTHVLDASVVHYEWNNTIHPRLTIDPGDTVTFETRDASDGFYTPRSTHEDVMRRVFKGHPLTGPILAGLVSWVGISLGFFGLKLLMQERPEFVGPPIRTAKAVLVQESPRLVARSISDDVSVIKTIQPESSDLRFDMRGRREYRGLKTVSDMSGVFTARYVLTNGADESMFVLFKCPHPRTESGDGSGLLAGGLKLQASVAGVQENAKDAWLWSGTVSARTSALIEVTYEVASLRAVAYRVADQNGSPLNQVRVTFQRTDLDSIRFESGDGTIRASAGPLVWERKNFLGPDSFSASIVEGRNLFTALSQLAEIGPLISLLFLVAVLAVIQVSGGCSCARGSATPSRSTRAAKASASCAPLAMRASRRRIVSASRSGAMGLSR